MGNACDEQLVIKHSRADRGYVITRKDGGRVGSIICNQTASGMDVFITNAMHNVWMVLDIRHDAPDSAAFLVPAAPIHGRAGKFHVLGQLARSTRMLGNKFVFQPVMEQDMVLAIGSALSRSLVIRRGGKDIGHVLQTNKRLDISLAGGLGERDKGIVVGIAIATCLQAELASNLKEDMKVPEILAG